MAERRMFAKSIIGSDIFLSLPLSSQCLYFHLAMRGDDEGFVNNWKSIKKMIGASDDDMNLLIAKKYVLVYESGVIVIKHWKIHNYIQNDRFKETTYFEEKAMLELDSKNAYKFKENGTIDNVSILDTQDRIGKDSIDKVSVENIYTTFSKLCPSLPTIQKETDKRNKAIKSIMKDYSIEQIEIVFRKAEESDFLSGRNGKWTSCNIDWLLNKNNFIKVLEGNYDNKGAKRVGDVFDNVSKVIDDRARS